MVSCDLRDIGIWSKKMEPREVTSCEEGVNIRGQS